MPTIKFTYALKRFYPSLGEIEVEAISLPEVLEKIDEQYPGIKSYLIDERGTLRKHVNIFVDGSLIDDRENLSDKIDSKSEIYFMQALSGG